MFKKLLILLLFVTTFVTAQDTIRVKINPVEDFKSIIIYSIKGGEQRYIANTSLVDEEFKLEIPEGSPIGMYRLHFGRDNGYFDFIYNHESVSVKFEATNPEMTAVFDVSEENKVYQDYLTTIGQQQYKVDSIQFSYFTSEKMPNLEENYRLELNNLYKLQDSFEKRAKDKFAFDFIIANEKFYQPNIVVSTQEYLHLIKEHFYDYVDFSNKNLSQSSFYVDKVIEYVFYVTTSEDLVTDQKNKKEAIVYSMQKIGDNYDVKASVLNVLMYTFASQQNLEMSAFVKKEYLKLPEKYISDIFISKIDALLKLAVGKVVPEIIWQEKGEDKKLLALDIAQNYVLVFWSTTCSHCLSEIPKLYSFTEKISNLKVIAVALEENEISFNEHIKTLPNWINILGLEKWNNEFAKLYDITSTPTYFVLDADKRIILKPKSLEELERYFRGY